MEIQGHSTQRRAEVADAEPQGIPPDTDVLVVGFGPVGAAIANLLGRFGVRTLVVDKDKEIFMSPRAIALDNEALRILQMAGLEDGDFDKVAIPYVRMVSPQLGEFGRINSLGQIDGHPKLVTFYQPQLEAALRRRALEHGGVRAALGVSLASFVARDDAVIATLDTGDGRTASVRTRYLIGADGASSLVRQLIGQEFKGRTYAQDWLIVDAHGAKSPIDHIEFICDYRRPVPHMTAPGGRERWEFMLRPGETRAEMEGDAKIRDCLRPGAVRPQMTIERKAVYRFHARTAKAFSKGRVFLAGDAAHITPPFAGQGLVAGLRDAANLSWKIAWVLQGRASPKILDSYDEERRPHAKAMIDMAKFMGRLIMPQSAAAALLTHGALRLTAPHGRDAPVFRRTRNQAEEPLTRGLFAPGRSGAKLLRGGSLPQGWVRGLDGAVRLSDEALGPALTLVGFGCDPRNRSMRPAWRRFRPAAAGSFNSRIAVRPALHLRVTAPRRTSKVSSCPAPRPSAGLRSCARPHRAARRSRGRSRPTRARKPRLCSARLRRAPRTAAEPAFTV